VLPHVLKAEAKSSPLLHQAVAAASARPVTATTPAANRAARPPTATAGKPVGDADRNALINGTLASAKIQPAMPASTASSKHSVAIMWKQAPPTRPQPQPEWQAHGGAEFARTTSRLATIGTRDQKD